MFFLIAAKLLLEVGADLCGGKGSLNPWAISFTIPEKMPFLITNIQIFKIIFQNYLNFPFRIMILASSGGLNNFLYNPGPPPEKFARSAPG